MPNRFLFGVAFDRPASRGEAFCFQNKQSPTLEPGWAGRLRSCNFDACLTTEGGFAKASAFYLTLFASGSSGLGINPCSFVKISETAPASRGSTSLSVFRHLSSALLPSAFHPTADSQLKIPNSNFTLPSNLPILTLLPAVERSPDLSGTCREAKAKSRRAGVPCNVLSAFSLRPQRSRR